MNEDDLAKWLASLPIREREQEMSKLNFMTGVGRRTDSPNKKEEDSLRAKIRKILDEQE